MAPPNVSRATIKAEVFGLLIRLYPPLAQHAKQPRESEHLRQLGIPRRVLNKIVQPLTEVSLKYGGTPVSGFDLLQCDTLRDLIDLVHARANSTEWRPPGGGRGNFDVDLRQTDKVGEPGAEAPGVIPENPAVDAEYRLWYGTNRKPIACDGHGAVVYGGERDNALHYGTCSVFIPRSHKIGAIGSPWWKRIITQTDDRLKLLATQELTATDHWAQIASHLATVSDDERAAVVFLHGYNVPFESAAIRAAQLGFDLSIKGAMTFFSWPSKGATGSYMADEASIEASAPFITDYLVNFAERTAAREVHIIAHSMGNRGAVRALERIALSATERASRPFGQLILAAADIDAQVFRNACTMFGTLARRATLYVSERDRAVEVSEWLHDYPRAGLIPPVFIAEGLDTVSVTNVDITLLGHGYVANARAVLTDIHALLSQNVPPQARFGIRRAFAGDGRSYWEIGS